MKQYTIWCPAFGQTRESVEPVEDDGLETALINWCYNYDEYYCENEIALSEDVITVFVVEDNNPNRVREFLLSGTFTPKYFAKEVKK